MRRVIVMCVLLLLCGAPAFAQADAATPAAPAAQTPGALPRLVKFSGTLADSQGTVSVTFALYKEQTGGTPLWQEVQQVTPDANGRYAVYVGAATEEGIPLDVFANGEARWLEVEVAGLAQPRVMFVSVPYALAAGDAQTLGGKPASAYVQAASEKQAASGGTGTATGPDATGSAQAGTNAFASDGVDVVFTNTAGTLTGYSVQNLGNTATSYSGMLFFDQNGALGQFQGFNNVSHEYRINNIASSGSINFMLGGSSKFLVAPGGNIGLGAANPGSVLEIAHSSMTPGFYGLKITDSVSNAIFIDQSIQYAAVYAVNSSAGIAYGVSGIADSASGRGVWGASNAGVGVTARTVTGTALSATSTGTGVAATFTGNVSVAGTLSKTAGSFKIDHPLDPENKYLSHSFVESPDMKNVYDGVVVLDRNGEAWVALPDWFEALNRDFRYQLTSIGAFMPVYIAAELANNQFKIAGGTPGGKVSWQLTGIRQDAYANAHRIPVEEDKSPAERGTFLHPELFGQSLDKAVTYRTLSDDGSGALRHK